MLQCDKYHSAQSGAFNQPVGCRKRGVEPVSAAFDGRIVKIRALTLFVACWQPPLHVHLS
ncbi:MAG: hypothetical protein WKG03_14055, partial [Telluria sp.]